MIGTRFLAILMLLAGLAGCLGGDDEPTDDHDGMDHDDGMDDHDGMDGMDHGNETMDDGNETDDESFVERAAFLDADVNEGDAPLAVTFSASVEAFTRDGNDTFDVDPGNFTWTLNYGDNSDIDQEGTQAEMPHTSTYSYEIAGTFDAILVVLFEDGEELSSNATITVAVAADPVEPPQDYFEFGPTLGCVGDFATCVGLTLAQNGGGVNNIDGHFQALDERYWGASLAVVMDPAEYTDSDCKLLDENFAVVGEANGGGDNCAGTVPSGTAWILLYPYAVPTLGMSLTFTFA